MVLKMNQGDHKITIAVPEEYVFGLTLHNHDRLFIGNALAVKDKMMYVDYTSYKSTTALDTYGLAMAYGHDSQAGDFVTFGIDVSNTYYPLVCCTQNPMAPGDLTGGTVVYLTTFSMTDFVTAGTYRWRINILQHVQDSDDIYMNLALKLIVSGSGSSMTRTFVAAGGGMSSCAELPQNGTMHIDVYGDCITADDESNTIINIVNTTHKYWSEAKRLYVAR